MCIRLIKAWIFALRPFSLVIALHSCGIGLAWAWTQGYWNTVRALIILLAGILAQAGVNLANDFFEFRSGNIIDKIPHLQLFGKLRSKVELSIFISALAFLGISALVGIYLLQYGGWRLLIVGVTGLIGGYAYTGEPINYKQKGIAIPIVSILMGVLMIEGAYLVLAATFSVKLFFLSIPSSLLVGHLLLSNELRDWEYDIEHRHQTLTYRIGVTHARMLFIAIPLIAYMLPFVFWGIGLMGSTLYLLPVCILLQQPIHRMYSRAEKRKVMIPWMMLHHAIYGLVYIFLILNPKSNFSV